MGYLFQINLQNLNDHSKNTQQDYFLEHDKMIQGDSSGGTTKQK